MGTPSYKTLPKTLKLEIVDAAKICAQIVFHFLKTRENTCGKQGGGLNKPVILPVENRGGEGGVRSCFTQGKTEKTRGISLRSLTS